MEKRINEVSITILRGIFNWPIHLIRLTPKCTAANLCKQSLFVYLQHVQITLSSQVTHHHHQKRRLHSTAYDCSPFKVRIHHQSAAWTHRIAWCVHAADWVVGGEGGDEEGSPRGRHCFKTPRVKCHTNTHSTCVLWPGSHIHRRRRTSTRTITGHHRGLCVYLPGWVQFHGFLTKWDVFILLVETSRGNQICASHLQLIKRFPCTPRCHRTAHHTEMSSKHLLPLSYPPRLPRHIPLLCCFFSPEPADRFDVLPSRRPHRLPWGLSEESQGARRTRQGAVGYFCRPGEEVTSPSQRWPITQVPLQKRWAVKGPKIR